MIATERDKTVYVCDVCSTVLEVDVPSGFARRVLQRNESYCWTMRIPEFWNVLYFGEGSTILLGEPVNACTYDKWVIGCGDCIDSQGLVKLRARYLKG